MKPELFVSYAIEDKPLDLRSVTTMVLDWERLKVFFGQPQK